MTKMEDKEKIHKIQKITLEILKEVIKICNDNNIDYHLCRGTLIGAIRHKGFIPWDDDIDIAMPRKDFDKFLEIANDKLPTKMEVLSYKHKEVYPFVHAKVSDTKTRVVEHYLEASGYESGVYIDVFPIDGITSNKGLQRIHLSRIRFYEKLLILSYLDENRHKEFWKKLLIKLGKRIGNRKKLHERIEKLLNKYPFEESELVNVMVKKSKREVMKREDFQVMEAEFQGLKVNIPKGYNNYLKSLYGNYMDIPSEKDRRQHVQYMNYDI